MIHDLMVHWPVQHTGSFVIGDRSSDIEAAKPPGCRASCSQAAISMRSLPPYPGQKRQASGGPSFGCAFSWL